MVNKPKNKQKGHKAKTTTTTKNTNIDGIFSVLLCFLVRYFLSFV
jgi:hypothetical protein